MFLVAVRACTARACMGFVKMLSRKHIEDYVEFVAQSLESQIKQAEASKYLRAPRSGVMQCVRAARTRRLAYATCYVGPALVAHSNRCLAAGLTDIDSSRMVLATYCLDIIDVYSALDTKPSASDREAWRGRIWTQRANGSEQGGEHGTGFLPGPFMSAHGVPPFAINALPSLQGRRWRAALNGRCATSSIRSPTGTLRARRTRSASVRCRRQVRTFAQQRGALLRCRVLSSFHAATGLLARGRRDGLLRANKAVDEEQFEVSAFARFLAQCRHWFGGIAGTQDEIVGTPSHTSSLVK
ncbi:hypothetical protein K488DRAFT_75264 [Vararia minispora EC-137]|uniref:Uncharacterized protein n=1 Tax=Vararia minispora EC-137 TaxID=1314806 RepID=A0ACB8Q481_9AGAM|nr:hypothetical protein K488DRAFT_75264 [Vararia minispora EC-137]